MCPLTGQKSGQVVEEIIPRLEGPVCLVILLKYHYTLRNLGRGKTLLMHKGGIKAKPKLESAVPL